MVDRVEKRVFNTRLCARSSWIPFHVKGNRWSCGACMWGDKWNVCGVFVRVCSRNVILHLYFWNERTRYELMYLDMSEKKREEWNKIGEERAISCKKVKNRLYPQVLMRVIWHFIYRESDIVNNMRNWNSFFYFNILIYT